MLRYIGTIAKEVVDRTVVVANFFGLLHVTNTYLFSLTHGYGPSMIPTLNLAGDVILTEFLSVRMGKVGLGDLVLVWSPENPRRTVIKRIMGMEGDTVTFLVDPNHTDRCRTIVVPKGHVWIQGDNIYASRDSRNYGPVPYGLIQGKACWRILPTKNIEIIEALALKRGVQLALQWGFESLRVEGDCLDIMEAMQNSFKDLSISGMITEDVKRVAGDFDQIILSHVPRSANRVAHHLANHGRRSLGLEVWLYSVPEWLSTLLVWPLDGFGSLGQ